MNEENVEEPEVPTSGEAVSSVEETLPEVPERVTLGELRALPYGELLKKCGELSLRVLGVQGKAPLVTEIASYYLRRGVVVEAEGVLEMAKDHFGMLRMEERSFRPSEDDVHVGTNVIKEYGLRTGNRLKVLVRAPQRRDKYLSTKEVLEVEEMPASEFQCPAHFDKLTSLFPNERLMLEMKGEDGLATRIVDLMAPIGKGQRGLIVAPPRGGKTILLKSLARSIRENHGKDVELVVLLLDERPEEVTDFEEMVDSKVYASTFDEPARRHAQVSDLVLERAKRLVEGGKDVVILLDSLTRLARGYNNSQRAGGPIGSGGLSPLALQRARSFFGAARKVEEGGSLTIIATCLIETESRMDDVIFEELKGTGNMEVRLDRELAERRIYPAIHLAESGTRNDDRLYHQDEMQKVLELRRELVQLPVGEAIEVLRRNVDATASNAELLLRGLR